MSIQDSLKQQSNTTLCELYTSDWCFNSSPLQHCPNYCSKCLVFLELRRYQVGVKMPQSTGKLTAYYAKCFQWIEQTLFSLAPSSAVLPCTNSRQRERVARDSETILGRAFIYIFVGEITISTQSLGCKVTTDKQVVMLDVVYFVQSLNT